MNHQSYQRGSIASIEAKFYLVTVLVLLAFAAGFAVAVVGEIGSIREALDALTTEAGR